MLSPEATRAIVARLEGEDPAKVLSLLDRVVENIYRKLPSGDYGRGDVREVIETWAAGQKPKAKPRAKRPETIARLFTQLQSTVTKKVCHAPLLAEWPAQVLGMLGTVRDQIDPKTPDGDPAVRHFLAITAAAGFMSQFGAPFTRLARRSDVVYDPASGTLSLPGGSQ